MHLDANKFRIIGNINIQRSAMFFIIIKGYNLAVVDMFILIQDTPTIYTSRLSVHVAKFIKNSWSLPLVYWKLFASVCQEELCCTLVHVRLFWTL